MNRASTFFNSILRSMRLGRSPLSLAIVWFFAALFAFVVMMNLKDSVAIDAGRVIFGFLSVYCACDLVYRVNHYHWR